MAAVEIEQFTYFYPTTTGPALQEINLSVPSGEFLAVVGANGAGKSSLCYAVSGFIPHFFKGSPQGNVRVGGLDILQTSLNEIVLKVGLVFQNPFNQISGAKFTVYEEIAFGLENLGIPRDEMRQRVDDVLQLTGISVLAGRSPYELSGGQQQRVALASILVMRPEVLVLDEPTSQLDPIGTREVFEVIKNLSVRGMTVILAEHKIERIAEFANRVIVLDEGKIIRQGTPADVLSDMTLTEHGIALSRFTTTANLARKYDLWPDDPLPVTLDEAEAGFRKILAQRVSDQSSN